MTTVVAALGLPPVLRHELRWREELSPVDAHQCGVTGPQGQSGLGSSRMYAFTASRLIALSRRNTDSGDEKWMKSSDVKSCRFWISTGR